MSTNKPWVEGTVVEFASSAPCRRATIKRVGTSQVVLADLIDGSTHKIDVCSLDKRKIEGEVKILAESRDFGELVFSDISDAEQEETIKRLKYVRAIMEKDVSAVTEKTSGKILLEVAEQLGEKPPHW